MKLIYSEKIEKELTKLNLDNPEDKADAYAVDGFDQSSIFEEGFKLGLKCADQKLNAYYAWNSDYLLYFIGKSEKEVLDKLKL